MKKISLLTFCIVGILTITNAKNVYVNPTAGNDAATGLSWKTAVKELAKAYELSANGDNIFVKGGAITLPTAWVLQAATKNIYGSFEGTENTASERPLEDKDRNGIIESWEFKYPTVISSSIIGNAITLSSSEIIFNGFTIIHTPSGTGIGKTLICANTASTFENNIIKDCVLAQTMSVDNIYGIVISAKGKIKNCLFENNRVKVTATADKSVMPIMEVSAGTKVTGCVLRNNNVVMDYSATANTANSNARGLIMNIVGGATGTPSTHTAVNNCLIYNNEISYIPNTNLTTLANGSTVALSAMSTSVTTDSITNCTIANNKSTKMKTAGLYVIIGGRAASGSGSTAVTAVDPVHIAINNVIWNNLSDNTTTNNNIAGSLKAGSISYNYSNGGATLSTTSPLISANNSTLNTDNTDAATGPNFIRPTVTAGNLADGSVEKANWSILPSSFLSGKGIATPRLTDKDGYSFATKPSVGAYEMYIKAPAGNSTISTLTDCATCNLKVAKGSELIINENRSYKSISIESGAKVTNNEGVSFTTENFTINSDANGTGTYVDNGITTINGEAKVNQFLTGLMGSSTRGWWYVASPVRDANSAVFNAENTVAPINKLGFYNEASTSYSQITNNASRLIPCVGYVANIAGADANYAFATSTGDANSKLNTGEFTINATRTGVTASARGFNLVGNPYPSYLNWNSVKRTNVRKTIWYRTHTGNQMQFDTFDGVVGTKNGVNGAVNEQIPPLQAFWVKVDADGLEGTLGLSNTMRSHQDQSPSKKLKAPSTTKIPLVRLKVSNSINGDETILVGNAQASNTYDTYDSPKVTNENVSIPEIYTLAGNEELVINNLQNMSANQEIALGFKTGATNSFTIKATEISNLEAGTKIILKDKVLKTEQDMTNGSVYSFTSDVSNTTSRFSIIFKSAAVSTGIECTENEAENLTIFKNENNQITIHSLENIGNRGIINISNTMGQKLASLKTTGTLTVVDKTFNAGAYLISISVDGKKTTKKIILN